MSDTTNPFRRSMLLRADSPFDEVAASPNNPFRSATPVQARQPSPVHLAAPSSGPSRVHPPPPRVPLPRRRTPDMRITPPKDSGETAPLAPPPPYWEANGRRHSDSSLPLNADEEKDKLRNDDAYRVGYEEGLRRERERQMRRRMRHHHHSSSPRDGQSGERGSSSSSSGRRRAKSESSKPSSSSSRRPRDPALDVIDQMDVTGLFGPGSFHHDGPFDAATPARNTTSKSGRGPMRTQPAPLEAFPMDGPNNSLAVVDPQIMRYRTEDEVYGRTTDQSSAPPEAVQQSFNSTDRTKPVHGATTLGLGSSTFLDGTRASKDAIAEAGRVHSESLGRSRSILRRQGSKRQPPLLSPSGSETPAAYSSERRIAEQGPSDPDADRPERPTGLLGRVRSLRVKRN